ncbi:S41 family peptidase [[Clostridium] leptum]|nr:S41 family peptidase [[Clostridium] leptum]
MSKRIPLGLTIALVLLTAAISISVTMAVSLKQFNGKLDVGNQAAISLKLSEIDSKIRSEYMGAIDEANLQDHIAAGYIAGIGDRYASYYSVEETKDKLNSLAGSEVGLGLKVTQTSDGSVIVFDVMADAPAQKAGLQEGDVITEVEGQSVTGMTLYQVRDLLIGAVGTTANFTVARGEETIPFSILRENYTNVSVSYSVMGGIGYVSVDEFNESTDEQFIAAMDDLQGQGVSAVVFDMRNNLGGTLDSVAKSLDYLLPEGPIVYKTAKNSSREVLYSSDAEEVELPMMVLVNGQTASAAELFACALRDYGKAQLVGTLTYGKGCMQNFEQLSDGSGINFTVANFDPPKSENFDGKGLIPDFEVTLTDEQTENFYLLAQEDDPQLQKALSLLREGLSATSEESSPSSEEPSAE